MKKFGTPFIVRRRAVLSYGVVCAVPVKNKTARMPLKRYQWNGVALSEVDIKRGFKKEMFIQNYDNMCGSGKQERNRICKYDKVTKIFKNNSHHGMLEKD